MSSYTMQLREYIEQATQNEDLPIRDKIKIGKDKLFDFDYPIFDTAYKNVFETHFIRNFYMREIGFETEGLFKFQLESWLLIHMPYFNKLFESELLKYDPLTNVEMNATYSKTNDKTQNDNRDKLKNDIRNKLQNDDRDITQNDQSVKHKEGSENALNTQTTNQTSTISGDSSGVTDTTSTTDSTKGTTGTLTDDNFNRELTSTNPDSRLAISANDGEGVIEYANSINEKNENNLKTTKNDVTGNDKNVSKDTSTTTSNQDSTSDVETVSSTDVSNVNDENSSLNRSVSDNLISNVNDTLSSSENDKLISSINDVEDYVQHRIGKVGIASYPKMIQEYRASFLRIEKEIFNEMNELFMLVY